MFGTVLADKNHLTEEQFLRYRACYCGLCHRLQAQYGAAARMVLRYDMVFLILLLASLYEPKETEWESRCVAHPIKKHLAAVSKITDYAAAMNVALAYYKCMDDWQDDKNIVRRGEASLLRGAMEKVQKDFPHKSQQIAQQLRELTELERTGKLDPDAGAACFGKLTAELFVYDPSDRWNDALRALGDCLGRYIYLSDALIDLKKDRARGRCNPLEGHVEPENVEAFLPILQGLMADCVHAFDRLPLVQDVEILKNILYSGVWIPYDMHRRKETKRRERLV